MIHDTDTIEIADWSKLPANPLVSVYMLAYRHESFIAEAIEGVIVQQCDFPIELIIGEDCSPDRTGEIARVYQRRYPDLIRVLTGSRNIGAHKNSARCRAACRGKYIAICEGDDFWHRSDKLAMQVRCMNEHPETDLVHTDYDRLIGKRVLKNVNAHNPPSHLATGDAYLALLSCVSVVTATSLYRKQAFIDIQHTALRSPDWPFGDYPMTLFAAAHGPIIYLPISTATYRYVPGSITNAGRQKKLALDRAVLDCRERFLASYKISPNADREVRIATREELRKSAILVPNKELYSEMYRWLCLNGAEPPILLHWVAQLVMTLRPILICIRVLRKTKYRIQIFMQYKRISN